MSICFTPTIIHRSNIHHTMQPLEIYHPSNSPTSIQSLHTLYNYPTGPVKIVNQAQPLALEDPTSSSSPSPSSDNKKNKNNNLNSVVLTKRSHHYAFVYGTLKRGFANHPLLSNRASTRFIGCFQTTQKYPLVVGGPYFSPYLLDIPGQGHLIKGELYQVDDDGLEELDMLENVGLNYIRETVLVTSLQNNNEPSSVIDSQYRAYVYLKRNYTEELINSQMLDDYQDRRYVPRSKRPQGRENIFPVGNGSHNDMNNIHVQRTVSV